MGTEFDALELHVKVLHTFVILKGIEKLKMASYGPWKTAWKHIKVVLSVSKKKKKKKKKRPKNKKKKQNKNNKKKANKQKRKSKEKKKPLACHYLSVCVCGGESRDGVVFFFVCVGSNTLLHVHLLFNS